MARMYPSDAPSHGTTSPAEKKLYYWFKENLSDVFVVFHGVRFVGQPRPGVKADREGDFIILHPDFGFLIIEVKGGQSVSYDATKDVWTINGRELQESPIEQAYAERRAIQDYIKSLSE